MPTFPTPALRVLLFASLAVTGGSVKATAATQHMARVHVGARGDGVLVASAEAEQLREEGAAPISPRLQTPDQYAEDYPRRDFDADLAADLDAASMDRKMAINKVRSRIERLTGTVADRRERLNSTVLAHEALKENLTDVKQGIKDATSTVQKNSEEAKAAQKKFDNAVEEADKLRKEYDSLVKAAREANATKRAADANLTVLQAKAKGLERGQRDFQRLLKKAAEKREEAAKAVTDAEEQLASARAKLRSLEGHSRRTGVLPLPGLVLSVLAAIAAWGS